MSLKLRHYLPLGDGLAPLAFELGRTLSEHGAVSRAVCDTTDTTLRELHARGEYPPRLWE